MQRKLLHIDAVHQHLPGVRVVQAGDQGHKRAFPRSGGADDADEFSRLYFHADIIQNRRANVLKVTEGHVPKFNAALFHAVLPPGGAIVADIRPGVHHLAEPAVGSGRPRPLKENVRQEIQGGQNLGKIGDKGGQGADFHASDHDLPSGHPHHHQRGHVDGKRGNRLHQNHHFQGGYALIHHSSEE